MRFLISSLLTLAAITSCAHRPTPVKFDGRWAFCEVIPHDPKWACLDRKDVIKLKTILNQCERRCDNR